MEREGEKGFNSTLVQLKNGVTYIDNVQIRRFNSTLVQLKIGNAE